MPCFKHLKPWLNDSQTIYILLLFSPHLHISISNAHSDINLFFIYNIIYNYERKTEVWRVRVCYATGDCLDSGTLHEKLKKSRWLLSVICVCQHFPDACSLILTIYMSPVCSLSYQQWHWVLSSQQVGCLLDLCTSQTVKNHLMTTWKHIGFASLDIR